MGLCSSYGISDWVEFDPSVVRGLAYYTGVVFEAFDRAGELRAICGGGRYDKLMSLYGSREEVCPPTPNLPCQPNHESPEPELFPAFGPAQVPCVGFGFGDCVIMELLQEKGLLPTTPHT